VNPYQVVKDFEQALCDYTGAKYAVTTTSCTMALLLACAWQKEEHLNRAVLRASEGDYRPTQLPTITIPKHTYVGVPMSIIHAGFDVKFSSMSWLGLYRLLPLPVWDCARYLTSDMYYHGDFMCVSFHWSKHLAIGQGGAILHDNDEADEWFRMMRFDGRQEGVAPRSQKDWVLGYHCYMSPRDAAEGLSRLAVLPEHNDPLPNDDYPDLSQIEIFK
jgi:dTDP-4-amino-4,6-dideoxygalactose transaminase